MTYKHTQYGPPAPWVYPQPIAPFAPPTPFIPNDTPPADYPVADLNEDDLLHEYARVKPLADHYASELERVAPAAKQYGERLAEVKAELRKRLSFPAPVESSPMPWDTDFPRRVLKDNPQA